MPIIKHGRIVQVATLALCVAACDRSPSAVEPVIVPCTPVPLAVPGTVTGVADGSLCTTSHGHAAAVYPFTSDTGTANAFTVTSTFEAPTVEVMTEPPDANVVWRSSTAKSVAGTWLLPAGTYFARVTSPRGSGAFTLTGSRAPAQPLDCEVRTLLVSVVLHNRTLAATDCQLPNGRRYDAYVIRSAKRCNITMRSTTVDSYLAFIDGVRNVVIGANDDSREGRAANISLPACNSDGNPMVIIATSVASSFADLGTYSLVVTLADPTP
jgi:hypothetical protein